MKCPSCKEDTKLEFVTQTHRGIEHDIVLCIHCKVIIGVLQQPHDSTGDKDSTGDCKKDYSIGE